MSNDPNLIDLIQAAKEYCNNPENIEKMKKRAKEAEDKFAKKSEDKRLKPEDYNRYYDL